MSGAVFIPARMADHLYPVKPWAVVCIVAPDVGLPAGRSIHWAWTRASAAGAARYLNQLLREDLLRAEPFARELARGAA